MYLFIDVRLPLFAPVYRGRVHGARAPGVVDTDHPRHPVSSPQCGPGSPGGGPTYEGTGFTQPLNTYMYCLGKAPMIAYCPDVAIRLIAKQYEYDQFIIV